MNPYEAEKELTDLLIKMQTILTDLHEVENRLYSLAKKLRGNGPKLEVGR